MKEREKMLKDHHRGIWTIMDLSRLYGVSRKTVYKWLRRYHALGVEGLKDFNRAPRHHPNATAEEIESRVIEFRLKHPTWGPRKVVSRLNRIEPDIHWPAPSTVGEIFKRHGLSRPHRRKRRVSPYNRGFDMGRAPNDVWGADFKGWFRTKDGTRIDPLTISDISSRYLLDCRRVENCGGASVRAVFEEVFREYGLPRAIRTDNGPPFASLGLGGLSKLAVWWIRLGIMPERIDPGHPEQNGRHERFHKTLKQATASPPSNNRHAQQEAFEGFRTEYNEQRPHESLRMKTPADIYKPSTRRYPHKLPEMEYGEGYFVRRVRSNGQIKWQGKQHYLSESLIGQLVGLIQVSDTQWRVDFGPIALAHYNSQEQRFERIMKKKQKKKVLPMCPV